MVSRATESSSLVCCVARSRVRRRWRRCLETEAGWSSAGSLAAEASVCPSGIGAGGQRCWGTRRKVEGSPAASVTVTNWSGGNLEVVRARERGGRILALGSFGVSGGRCASLIRLATTVPFKERAGRLHNRGVGTTGRTAEPALLKSASGPEVPLCPVSERCAAALLENESVAGVAGEAESRSEGFTGS